MFGYCLCLFMFGCHHGNLSLYLEEERKKTVLKGAVTNCLGFDRCYKRCDREQGTHTKYVGPIGYRCAQQHPFIAAQTSGWDLCPPAYPPSIPTTHPNQDACFHKSNITRWQLKWRGWRISISESKPETLLSKGHAMEL